jgi:hypothetical protein
VGQDLRHLARVLRRQMGDDDEGKALVRGHLGKEALQGVHAACRRADRDNRQRPRWCIGIYLGSSTHPASFKGNSGRLCFLPMLRAFV